jgi:signal transduction histidine kinase
VILLPEGYSSPYFLFFVFLLLSSAIRWNWRVTALTGLVVLALYLVTGFMVSQSAHSVFETRRFIIRSGYLLVLSAVLIWFGVRRRFAVGSFLSAAALDEAASDEPPLSAGLRHAMRATRATGAVAIWKSADGGWEKLRLEDGTSTSSEPFEGERQQQANKPFLFDARRDRALVLADAGVPQFASARSFLGEELLDEIAPVQGIAIPVRSKLGNGLFLLWGVRDLHSDHLELGDRLTSELAQLIERFSLLAAMRESAIARERLSLARDLHDGIVQFLAGSAYKIEAISELSMEGTDVSADLQELKRLMLLEQEDLRSSIGTLRKDQLSLLNTAADAEALCERLSRQWNLRCNFSSDVSDRRIKTQLHADLLHMIKEGVANAARHASAQTAAIALKSNGRSVELKMSNDGSANLKDGAVPWSIRERTAEAGGSAEVSARDGLTTVLVVVPIGEPEQ